MLKNLVFVLKTNQDFIRYCDSESKDNEAVLSRLFDDISDIYIPIRNCKVEDFPEDE